MSSGLAGREKSLFPLQNEEKMEPTEYTQPLMPMLLALRKRKIKINMGDGTAKVWNGPNEGEAVEAVDLVRAYSTGHLELDAFVSEVLERVGGSSF
jgi:hypothetical protein